jgi:hypothetical protein
MKRWKQVMVDFIIGILFIIFVIFLWAVQVAVFPIMITVQFLNILFPAMFLAFSLAVSSYLALKKYSRVEKTARDLFITVFVFCTIYFFSGKLCAQYYIKSIAENKYDTVALRVDVNFGKWVHFEIFGEGFRGYPHAYIIFEGKKRNWSFYQRDFVK